MKKFSKCTRIFLRVVLVLSTAVYPGLMAMLSAAGWRYNVEQGHYPELFRVFSGWMYAGGILLCTGAVLCLFGAREQWWQCNIPAIGLGGVGCTACLSVLYRFCAYADQHFSGLNETMEPVSQLYRDRLLPVVLPALVLLWLCVWQIVLAAPYRHRKHREKEARLNAEAPRILKD